MPLLFDHFDVLLGVQLLSPEDLPFAVLINMTSMSGIAKDCVDIFGKKRCF
jgi:hypothetical protein